MFFYKYYYINKIQTSQSDINRLLLVYILLYALYGKTKTTIFMQ